jgi:predicted nucleotidyltransferase
MDMLLHPAGDGSEQRPAPGGRLSTVGHRAAFRAFARAARRAEIRFMVIGGTFRDVAVRAASTRDIDIVLVDAPAMDAAAMAAAGFERVPGSPHAWRYRTRTGSVALEIAAVASSRETRGPFSVAYQQAERRTIEGIRVAVPRVEDYVILKLWAAASSHRRRARDLVDIQYVFEAFPGRLKATLSVAAIRGRLRKLYGVSGERLTKLIGLLRQVPRPPRS